MRTIRTAARVVPATALVAILGACGTDSGELSAQPSPGAALSAGVVSVSALDEPSGPEGDAPASACTSRDIDVSFGDPNGGATGERSMALRFTNNGPGPCVLNGRPSVEFLDAEGNPVGLREDENGNGRQYVHGIGATTFRLPSAAGVDVQIAKYRCDLGDKAVAAEVRVGLPGEGTTTALVINPDAVIGGVATCLGGDDDPGQTFAISGYTLFECHLVGNATGGGWCDGELGKQPAQTVDEAAHAAQKEELAGGH